MSQIDLADAAAASYIGIESSFNTTPTMTRCFPMSGLMTTKRDDIRVEEERPRGRDSAKTVQNFKSWEGKFEWNLKAPTGQLNASATPTATPWPGIPLRAAWGGEVYAAGSTVQSSSTTTSVIVGTGHGTRFPVGTWIGVEVAGALEWTRVMAVSTDTLSVKPSLSATPNTSAGLVINSYTYYPTETNSNSLTIQHAKAGSSSYQWTFNGANGDVELVIERGKRLTAALAAKGLSWTGPSAQSISTAVAADASASPMGTRGMTFLLQAASALTKVHYPIQSISVKLASFMEQVLDVGGSNENVSSWMAVPKRPAYTLSVKSRVDLTIPDTWYASQTTLSLVGIATYGSGLTARAIIFDFPSCFVATQPAVSNEGGRDIMSFDLEGMEDALVTGTTDLAYACMRLSFL